MAKFDIQTNLRLPSELKEQLLTAAAANTRTLTAEIVARLKASFEDSKALPFDVIEAVDHEMEMRGGTFEEAHVRMARTAMANGGTLFHATITPQTTIAQFREMLEASRTMIPPEASIIMERKSVKSS
jgi:predicted DNA-binding protein